MRNQFKILCMQMIIESLIHLLIDYYKQCIMILSFILIFLTLLLILTDYFSLQKWYLQIVIGILITWAYAEVIIQSTARISNVITYKWLIIILFQVEMYQNLREYAFSKIYYLLMNVYIPIRMIYMNYNPWLESTQIIVYQALFCTYVYLCYLNSHGTDFQSEKSQINIQSTMSNKQIGYDNRNILNDCSRKNYNTIKQRGSSAQLSDLGVQSPMPFNRLALEPLISFQDELINCLPYGLIFLNSDFKIVKNNKKAEVYLSSKEKNEMLNLLNLIISENTQNEESADGFKASKQSGKRISMQKGKQSYFAQFEHSNKASIDSRWSKRYSKDCDEILRPKGLDKYNSQKCVKIPFDNPQQRQRNVSIFRQTQLEHDQSPLQLIFQSDLGSHRVLPVIPMIFSDQKKKLNQSLTINSDYKDVSKLYVRLKVKGEEKTFLLKFLELDMAYQQNSNEGRFLIIMENITNKEKLKILQNRYQFQNDILKSFSHELRTPINQSLSLLNSLTTYISSGLYDQYLQPAIVANKRLLYQINDIIDYKNIECYNFQINVRKFTFQFMIDQINELFAFECSQKEIKLTIVCDVEEDHICNDYERIMQVIVNLMNNSIKFTKQKGELRCRITKNNHIDDNLFCISIWDNGMGINKIRLANVQNELKRNQDNDTYNPKDKFIGLGLSVSNKIVSYLCVPCTNSLMINSIENIYTLITFFVEDFDLKNSDEYIPSDGDIQIQKVYKYEHTPNTTVECQCNDILICDDVAFNHLALKALLNMLHINADSAYDGAQAMQKVSQKLKTSAKHGCLPQYKMILMDVEMPGIDGFQATKNILNFLKQRHIIVGKTNIIMCSAYSGKNMLIKAKESGMIDVLPKPIQVQDLKILLNQYFY